MKKSKRLLALVCTLLMLTTCFALPYGALAAEEEEVVINKSDAGQIVATLQGETPAVAQQGGDQWVGKTLSLDTPYTFEKATSNYMITLEVMIHQDYGFTDPAWIFSCLGDGNLQIVGKDAEGADVTVTNPVSYTNMLKNGGVNKEDTWFQVQIPLAKLTASSFSQLKFNTYVHACRWDSTNYPTDNSKCKNGCRISYRNVVVRDMSRNAQGGLSETVAVFGQEEVDYTRDHTAATTGAKAIVPFTDLSYSVIDANMALEDLYFEFDMMYEGGENATNQNIKNGQLRLYTGNTEHQGHNSWGNNIVNKANTWFHISAPLSGFTGGNALTDATGITRAYAFNYNDGKAAFTAHAKNIKITYKPVTDALQALEDAKNFTYEVDDNATAYEAALNDVRAIFTDETVNYTDVAGLLTALDAAEANLTNKQDLKEEVLRFQGQEYTKTEANGTNNKQFYYNWSTGTGLTSGEGVDLRDDNSAENTAIGENRYFQMTVTLKHNSQWAGETPATLDLFDKAQYRVRSYVSSGEKRTNDYNLNILQKTVTEDEAVYVLEGLLDASAQNAVEWDKVRESIIFVYITQASGADSKVSPVTCTLSDVRIVNKTAEAIDAGLKECAEAYIAPGKYTAASTANYMALQSEAQAMVSNSGATMQEKSQLIKRINAAKDEFVAIVPEFVQFGQPDTEITFTNTGIEGQHSMFKTYSVTNNAVTDTTDISNLKLRMELYVARNDGMEDISKVWINGGINIRSTTEMKRGGNITASGMKADEWNTLYFNLSDFSDVTLDNLKAITNVYFYGYNDLRGATADPGISVKVRNIAIVDATNTDAVAALADAFYDVTKEGTVDFTPDSLAAYQAVYDEWYPVYQFVDLARADEAIAAMKEAYKLLVCVDKEVMTFSQTNTEWAWNGSGQFYVDWRAADQGMTDISTRNLENLRIRFDFSFKKVDETAADLPATLPITGYRLAIRKWNSAEDKNAGCTCKADGSGGEHDYGVMPNGFPMTVSSTGVNSMEMALSDMNTTNTDGLLRDFLFWISVDGMTDVAKGAYVMVMDNVRLVDITKDVMEEELAADANASVDDFGVANGVVYDENEAGDLKAAQAKALEVLAKENPTYKELDDAQKAIDAAIDGLTAYGHTVMEFPEANKSFAGSLSTVSMNWVGASQPTDLSAYNQKNLYLRMTITFDAPEGYTMRSSYLRLNCTIDGKEHGRQYFGEKVFTPGVHVIDVPFDTQQSWGSVPVMPADQVHKFWFMSYCKDADGGVSTLTDAKFTLANARIVDITAEKNLGTVEAVGNGAIDITGGLLYGKDDVLSAKTSSETAKFVGWKVNDKFFAAVEGEANTQALKATGSQNVAAYFVEPDETVVVYYGKYNRVIGTQVVTSGNDVVYPTVPTIRGYSFANWSDDNLAASVDANKGGVVAVEAIYKADELAADEGYTVTLVDATANKDVTAKFGFDAGIKVTAADKAGMAFSHWTINGAVASCAKEMTFYVSGDVVVVAHYVDEGTEVVQVPAAEITQSRYVAEEGGKYTFEVIGQTFTPDTYELLDYGVVFAPNDDVLAAMMKGEDYDANYIRKVVSSSRIANRQYQVNMTGVAAGKTRCAVAYVTVQDANGVVTTVYSAINTVTTPAA